MVKKAVSNVPDIRAKLAGLVTQHPGGYAEIYETLGASGAQVDVITQVWNQETAAYDPKVSRVAAVEIAEEIGKVATNPYLIKGVLAAEVAKILSKYKLPTPGDERWLQPAANWLKA